ncbi:alpha/beta hydrolase [Halomicroarcula sp. S1AR25-4]|uniref:alpha/beta fold hydrolase n=1 Tax=Haloarcula sp. S1AR25-4 TaxID=2950538 RepID=UPI002874D41B|nr:alpha/beta hydrolase [Halomicroarcula sp. S1AR25-4]MDS0277723.1 alpha/beta hydrolase [Halomicroarcula sp. S1AR25-4]
MRSIQSTDQTTIAYERSGDGQPVVLIHGTTGTHQTWDRFRSHLPDGYGAVAPDRRGRGASGDGDEYALDREVADIVALVESFGETPVLFGHSFGGLCALEAARQTDVDRLILYEPAILVGDDRADADLASELRGRLDAGDRAGVIEAFFMENSATDDPTGLPIEERTPLAETVVRESAAVEQYELPDTIAVDAPTLLITGTRGPSHLRNSIRAVADVVETAQLVELDGLGHVGIWNAPERIGDVVESFLPAG